MKSNSILFVGCGDLGVRTGTLVLADGWQVAGLCRNPARLPAAFAGIAGDYVVPGSLDAIRTLQPGYVVATFNPSDRSIAGYREGFTEATQNLLAGLGEYRPRGVFMVSSTRVYAERNGGWVDEDSPLASDDPRALAIIAAEQILLKSAHRACIIRFAGIYGSPGGRLQERIRRGDLVAPEPVRYSNRIHRDDCAGFMRHLVQRLEQGAELAPVYNGVDDLPAPQFEVESWLAAAMGVRGKPSRSTDMSGRDAGQSSPAGHKRCSNRLLHASGYELLYPDYRSGYQAVLAASS